MYDDANTAENRCDHEVTAKNVASLAVAWEKDGLVGVTGVPAVDGGVVYFGDETGTEWAVQAANGKVLWSAKLAGGQIVGAPAVTSDAVYVGIGGTLYRLNRSTGAVAWKATTNTDPSSQINASPIVLDDEVIIGTASFQVTQKLTHYTFQGSIGAFDAATGKQRWNYVTTPNDATSGAGEAVWSTPAVDRKLGLLYFGTGQNLAPPAGPHEDSLVALDYRTGKAAWVTQAVSNDVFSAGYPQGFDYDFGASPNLFTVNGRELVGAGDKEGTYWALDAKTGDEVWKTKLAPAGHFGGVIGSAGFIDGRLLVSSNIGSPTSFSPPDTSKVFALSPGDGNVQWTIDLKGSVFGPITGVPGVAFVGTSANHLYALDPVTGRTLWTHDAPGPVGGGPSIVGRQVFWGYGFTLFSGPGKGGLLAFAVP